uniref:Potassium channel domain-containing protein n=1 Tax=Heterosigma akashiwo TaxID=2829 RepID=A0A6V1TE77_HETAK|mmetsp:Transcript_39452/g.68168  ORF Transcript_39452/g.68168 Transcript_39452/m.68168 type:complete len:309 (-) Transcript_39452:513-1439(-)
MDDLEPPKPNQNIDTLKAKTSHDTGALFKSIMLAVFLPVVALVVGGASMSKLEYAAEKARVGRYDTLLKELRNLTVSVDAILNGTSGVSSKFEDFMTEISPYLNGKESVPDVSDPFWNLEGSVFFCWTIMTTIGYGDYAPKTNGGKVFTFFFTIISVPLFVVALAHLSSMLAKAAEAVFREYHDRFCNNKNSYVPGIVSLGLFFLLVLSVGFSASQSDWSYLDACYFSIISLTTVGLGDYSPSLDNTNSWAFILYLWLGLLLVGAIISSMQNLYDVGASFVVEKGGDVVFGKKTPKKNQHEEEKGVGP